MRKDLLPPPSLHQKKPPPPPPPSVPPRSAKAKLPPRPLPTRNNPERDFRPALPPRTNSSNYHSNMSDIARTSTDSNASSYLSLSPSTSVSSFSTAESCRTSTVNSSDNTSNNRKFALRAPAWGEAKLPALPARKGKGVNVNGKNATTGLKKDPAPPCPSLQRNGPPSPDAVRVIPIDHVAPKPPPRSNTHASECAGNGGGCSKFVAVRAATFDAGVVKERKIPPPLPRRDVLKRVESKVDERLRPALPERKTGHQAGRPAPPPRPAKEPPKRAVPPPPHAKSQFLSLSSMNRIHEEKKRIIEENVASIADGVQNCQIQESPPPIPLSTRPDLSKIQATKARFSTPIPSAATGCLKCRDFSAPDTHASRFPRETLSSHDFAWLAMQLTSPFPSATDKARAIFTWLHHNVAYDAENFFNKTVGPQSSEDVLRSGKAVCEGYATIFETLARCAGLQALKISGHGAGYGFSKPPPGAPIPPFESTHAWNVVQIDDGHWKLIDACWGAGHVNGPAEGYVKKFHPEHFTMSNDEFGRKHYPTNPAHFFRDDGRPNISWEEYMLNAPPKCRQSAGLVTVFTSAKEESIAEETVRPSNRDISVRNSGPIPIRFEFGLRCPHWTLQRHSRISAPYLYVLATHGVDGRKDELLPLTYVPGRNPGGGGDTWFVDVHDARTLGAPGQSLGLYALTKFGGREGEAARGLSVEEFRSGYGRCGWAMKGVAQWILV